MPVIAIDNPRLSALIKNLDTLRAPELFNELVTVNEAAAVTYTLGQVLGKVTATGKYIISKPAASDGSQTPVAIYIGTGDALGAPVPLAITAATDTKVLVLARGKAVVSAAALVLDASINTPTLRAAVYASLKTVGILVEAAV